MNSDEQYYYNVATKKKKKRKNAVLDSVENAKSKRHHIIKLIRYAFDLNLNADKDLKIETVRDILAH